MILMTKIAEEKELPSIPQFISEELKDFLR